MAQGIEAVYEEAVLPPPSSFREWAILPTNPVLKVMPAALINGLLLRVAEAASHRQFATAHTEQPSDAGVAPLAYAPVERQLRADQSHDLDFSSGSVASLREQRLTDPRIHETGPPESRHSSAAPPAALPSFDFQPLL